MRDGRVLARLQWSVAAAVGAALVAAVLAPLASAPADALTPPLLLRTCGHLAPTASAGQVATVALSGLALLVLLRGASAAVTVVHGMRRAGRLAGRPVVLHGHRVIVVPSSRLAAFTVGWLRPRTFLSDGALHRLDADQLAAVIEHERHHCRRRDPLRLAARRVISEAFFFVPALRRLRDGHDELAELDADAAAARAAGGDVRPLLGALLAFDGSAPAGGGVSPARVDRLLDGRPLRWSRSGLRDVAASLAVAAGLAAIAVVAATVSGAADHAFRVCVSTLVLTAGAASIAWKAKECAVSPAGSAVLGTVSGSLRSSSNDSEPTVSS
jgi:hypothetical protein